MDVGTGSSLVTDHTGEQTHVHMHLHTGTHTLSSPLLASPPRGREETYDRGV